MCLLSALMIKEDAFSHFKHVFVWTNVTAANSGTF